MNDNLTNIRLGEARIAYRKFIRSSRGPFGIKIFGKNDELKKFVDVQREHQAYNSSYLGIKTVNIDEVTGSVQKYTDFEKNFVPKNAIVESRWCNIYVAFMNEANLPLVQLYKIKDEYFVYDGNHRISVANFMKFRSIEAEVTEFLPSTQKKEDVIYRENFLFQKETDITDINFSEIHQYRRIKKEIKDFKIYLEKKGSFDEKDATQKELAQAWYESLYKPVIEFLEINDVLNYFIDRTISDVFIYFLDHKYYKSEETSTNVGFTYALIDFVNVIKTNVEKDLDHRFLIPENLKEKFYKIKRLEKRMEFDREILLKLDDLKEVTGIDFEHNFVILYEIDKHFEKKGFKDYKEAIKSWYRAKLLNFVEELESRGKMLPEKYSEKLPEITVNNEMLFYQFRNYKKIYEKKYKRKVKDLIANYILDIYIPMVEIIDKIFPQTQEFQNIYSEIYGKYLYLFEYNRNVTLNRAAELYVEDKELKHYKTTDWFGMGYSNNGKLGETIDIALEKMDKSMALFFKKLIIHYGKPGRYETLFKLEELYNQLLEEYGNEEEVENKIITDMKKLYDQNELNVFYKTKAVLLEIQKNEKFSFIDYYISIMNDVAHLGTDRVYLDIVDLTFDYINR